MIDICIVTYRNEETICNALNSVETMIPDARVLIWDNSPDDLTRDRISKWHSSTVSVAVYGNDVNLGFGRACNRLAEAAIGPWLMFLNPDAEIVSWNPALIDANRSQMTGALVQLPDGSVQSTFGRDRTMRNEFRSRLIRMNEALPDVERSFDTDFVSGAALLVHREEFRSVGGFDTERFFMYYEDVDLGRRWRSVGHNVRVDPTWGVVHLGGHSAKKDHLSALVRSYESALAYHERWSSAAPIFRALCVVEATMKLLVSLPVGHVGQTSRATQWDYFLFLIKPKVR